VEYLILRRIAETGLATDWQPVAIASVEGKEPDEAVKQGYTGDGRYKAVPWPEAEGSEFDLGPQGPPVATPVCCESEEEDPAP
jgi:hypothetical protein